MKSARMGVYKRWADVKRKGIFMKKVFGISVLFVVVSVLLGCASTGAPETAGPVTLEDFNGIWAEQGLNSYSSYRNFYYIISGSQPARIFEGRNGGRTCLLCRAGR